MEPTWKFQRGDVYFVRLELGIGSEQNGVRPAVILQNDVGNTCSPTLIVAALTSKTDKKAMQPTHSLVELDGLEPSVVQTEQIFTIDKSRVIKYLGHLTPEDQPCAESDGECSKAQTHHPLCGGLRAARNG